MFLRSTTALAILLWLLPTGLAGGTLDEGFVFIQLEDEREDCTLPVAGFCSFDYEWNGTVGSIELDVRQKIQYIGVAVDLPLLPDHSLVLRGNDLYVMNPATPVVTEAWSDLDPDYPGKEIAWIELTRHHAGIVYHGPWVLNPTGPWRDNGLGMEWTDESGTDYYERIGPHNADGGDGQTDNILVGFGFLCRPVNNGESCDELEEHGMERWRETTPNVRVAFHFWDVQVATDPSLLTPPVHSSGAEASPEEPPAASFDADASMTHDADLPSDVESMPPPVAEPEPARDPSLDAPGFESATVTVQQSSGNDSSTLLHVLVSAGAGAAILFLLGALYSRITRARLLTNPTRERIYMLIRKMPGIDVAEITRQVDVARNAVWHHVKALEKHGLILAKTQGCRTRRSYFATAAGPQADEHDATALLKNPARKALAELILVEPMTQQVLGTRTGHSQRFVSYHLAKLEAQRLAESDAARPKRYIATEKLRAAMANGRPTQSPKSTA